MATKIYRGAEARKIILDGARELYETVKETYGPTSGNVGILTELKGLDVTHDGVTVATSIDLEGPMKAGAEVIKYTAKKMDKELGDGTTTVVILAFSIIEAVQDALLMGQSPIKIKNELQGEASFVLSKLESLTDKKVTKEKLEQVAGISASDVELGKQVADIVWQVGAGGNVNVEDGVTAQVEAEVVEGFSIDNGAASNYMIQDSEKMNTVLEFPKVLVANKKLTDNNDLIPVLKEVGNSPLLVVANDISDSVLSTLISTNYKKLTNIVFVKSPRFADKRTQLLVDLASVVGTEVVDDKQVKFDGVKLGEATKVVVTTESTTILEGRGDISGRQKEIQGQIDNAPEDFEKKEAEQRLAALSGKAAVIKVGGLSEEEVSEKRYRVDDAVFACQAALKSGVVAGGGTTLIDLSEQLPEDSVLRGVLKQPFRVLMDNIGLKGSDLDKDAKIGGGRGVNTRTGEVVDLFENGIIEPAETVRKAIESAVSIAGTAITMKALIVEEDDE